MFATDRGEGSGIYVTPALVLRATNSVGISLVLWTFGAVFGLCGLLVWLELGLSIPKFQPPDGEAGALLDGEEAFENVPRSGGEKNYVRCPEHSLSRTLILLPARIHIQ